jgi:hypothetical protein
VVVYNAVAERADEAVSVAVTVHLLAIELTYELRLAGIVIR